MLTIFIYTNHNPKIIDSITQLLTKFLQFEESTFNILFMEALVDVIMKYDTVLIAHKVVIFNIHQTFVFYLICTILYHSCDDYLLTLAIFQTDNLNDFIEYTSINYDLSRLIEHKLLFECNQNYKFVNDIYKSNLLDLAAYNSSVNIFKHLLLNNVMESESVYYYSIAGGNTEIIRILVQNKSMKDFYYYITSKAAIEYHRTEIFYWLLEQELVLKMKRQ